MNALIIVTVALTGPLSSELDTPLGVTQPVASNHAALAAFDGPTSALALGAGDALGYELFAVEVVAYNYSTSFVASVD